MITRRRRAAGPVQLGRIAGAQEPPQLFAPLRHPGHRHDRAERQQPRSASDIVLCMPRAEEACSIGLAPTSSTTMQLALGDAIAMSLLEDKGFDARRFKDFHPGGKLGAALTHVREIMHGGDAVPLCEEATPMSHALLVMTAKSLGCLGVLDRRRRAQRHHHRRRSSPAHEPRPSRAHSRRRHDPEPQDHGARGTRRRKRSTS